MHASISQIKRKTRRKTNPSLVSAINAARKNKFWGKLAHILSGPTRKHSSVNLNKIELNSKAGDTIIVPGKVLSSGNITKKIKIIALSISSLALEKLKETKTEFASFTDEIKVNPKAEGVKIIR